MATTEYKANDDDFATSNDINALNFFVRSIINKTVSTAQPVVVTGVERNGTGGGAGYVQVKPIIQEQNNDGEGLGVVDIPRIPYFRYQHGNCAIVCDPKVGDIGLAVTAKKDISNIEGNSSPQVPATYRLFDPSDSFYIGGFWGSTPTTFIHLEDDGDIEITAPVTVKVKSPDVQFEADTFTVNAPAIALNGAITGGGSSGYGATFTGSIKSSGDMTAGSISLQTHRHGSVQAGSGTSGEPVS